MKLGLAIDRDRQAEVIDNLDQAGALNRDFVLLVLLSCVIASLGLVLNSAAVIIGAMLIAPLMSPILRCALALVRGDLSRIGRALGTLAIGMLLFMVNLIAILFAGSFTFVILGFQPTIRSARQAVVSRAPQIEGTLVQRTGRTGILDQVSWIEVVLPDGRTGWIVVEYLAPYRAFVAP